MSTSSSTTSVTLRSPAARACHDVMQCVFAFLTLTELIRVARCCTQWDKWATQQPSRTDTVKIMTHFDVLSRSRMLRHVSEIALINDECKIEDINRLRSAAPKLRRMDIAIDILRPPYDTPFQLPFALTDLTITIDASNDRVIANVVSGVCNAVALQKINLNIICGTGLPMSSFENILRLTQLESLTISRDAHVNDDHLHIIKQMPSLRSLSLFNEDWLSDDFQTLCTPPHSLHNLEEIRMQRTWMDETHIESLQHIPTLTRLNPSSMTPAALHLLRHHLPPACVHLSVCSDEPASIDDLFAIDLTRIQTLHVSDFISFSNDDAFRFLSTRLPSTTDLSVHFRLPHRVNPTRLCMPRLRRLAIDTYENLYDHLLPEHFTDMPALTSLDLVSIGY